jgi:hypothetical protein
MNGKVYLFNVNAEDMGRIQIRTFPTQDTIKGWHTDSSTRYQPNALAIERFKLPEEKFGFCQGSNQVTFSRPTFNGAFTLNIDPAIPLSDDLILYVMRENAMLMRTNGEIIEDVKFLPTRTEG